MKKSTKAILGSLSLCVLAGCSSPSASTFDEINQVFQEKGYTYGCNETYCGFDFSATEGYRCSDTSCYYANMFDFTPFKDTDIEKDLHIDRESLESILKENYAQYQKNKTNPN